MQAQPGASESKNEFFFKNQAVQSLECLKAIVIVTITRELWSCVQRPMRRLQPKARG